jgi:hypothetical protein
LIEYERFALLEAFGDYTDTMIESMVDKNEKRTPANTRVRFGIQRVLYVKAVSFLRITLIRCAANRVFRCHIYCILRVLCRLMQRMTISVSSGWLRSPEQHFVKTIIMFIKFTKTYDWHGWMMVQLSYSWRWT